MTAHALGTRTDEFRRGDIAELVRGDGYGTPNGTQFAVGAVEHSPSGRTLLHERDRICFHDAMKCCLVQRAEAPLPISVEPKP